MAKETERRLFCKIPYTRIIFFLTHNFIVGDKKAGVKLENYTKTYYIYENYMIEHGAQISIRQLGQSTVFLTGEEIVSEIDLARIFHLGRQTLQEMGELKCSKKIRSPLFRDKITHLPSVSDTFIVSGCLVDNIFGLSERGMSQEFTIAGLPQPVEEISRRLLLMKDRYLPYLQTTEASQGSWNLCSSFNAVVSGILNHQSAKDALAHYVAARSS